MNPREQGFLLLTSHLGDPARKILTDAQLRTLTQRIQTAPSPEQDREMTVSDLTAIGYDPVTAEHILTLLSQQEQLDWYLQKGARCDCFPLTRASDAYPAVLRQRLEADSPGCLWYKGDLTLLSRPAVALVGSRDLRLPNQDFARETGEQAARQGFVLISGNARGADRTAQDACLEFGGSVISIVADALQKYPLQRNVLYLSEDGFDLGFSAARALHRNRLIHSLASKVFVAQCAGGTGGTWSGTVQNLRYGWSPVFCYDDGSEAAIELMNRGCTGIGFSPLENISAL